MREVHQTNTVYDISYQTDTAYDTSYLTAVTAQTTWKIQVSINGGLVPFKLDTGAEVTVISEETLRLLDRKELQSSNKTLCGRSLDVVGEISTTISYKDRSCKDKIYVSRIYNKTS